MATLVAERIAAAMNADVMVCGIRDGRIGWARLYVEPVEGGGCGIAAAVQRMTGDA